MPRLTHFVFTLFLILAIANTASAFGAGAVPDGSEFKEFVWRHGDIVEVLRFLPASFLTKTTFTQLQRRQIYFGNWLRDFSQVVDTTCLENIPEPILRAIVSIMAMLEFGYATEEFEVTRERLGCYSHVEHIDNPQGYDSHAKDVDTRLRGPVDPKELEIDPKSGMKNYIANSGCGWDTSADYVRRQLEKCIELGRAEQDKDRSAAKESFIHLGAALHTLEDFAAHSNFIELCLHQMGEEDIFAFVGDQCTVKVPWASEERVAPLITGTFGMLDIFHSLLGEADDMAILQSKGSLGQLETSPGYGAMAFDQLFEAIKAAISAVQNFSEESSKMLEKLEVVKMIMDKMKKPSPSPPPKASDSSEPTDPSQPSEPSIQAAAATTTTVADEISTEAQKNENKEEEEGGSSIVDGSFVWDAIEPIFYVHDRMKRWVLEHTGTDETNEDGEATNTTSEMSEITNKFVFRVLWMIIESSVSELRQTLTAAKSRVDEEASKSETAAVYEPGSTASDPSHSDLSKDHFSNVLNRPAGLVATITTNWVTQQVVKCWDDASISADDTIKDILHILHHPAFPENKTDIQQYMFAAVEEWWNDMTEQEHSDLREKLGRDSVKERGHEDHELSEQDILDKKKGPGEFPGSKFDIVIAKPKTLSPGKWITKTITTNTAWALSGLWSVINGIRELFSKLWPFRSNRQRVSSPGV